MKLPPIGGADILPTMNCTPPFRTIRSVTIILALYPFGGSGQYNGPESVEYDPVGDRYFVSNTATGVIRSRDQAGVVTDFATVSPPPYGLEIMGETLYACSGGGIKGYSLSDGSLVYERDLGGSFCNGITTDGSHLYVTDFPLSAKRIFKVDPVADEQSILVANTGAQPNGIVWDPMGDRLVVVFWGSNAPIRSYDPITGGPTTLVANTGLANIDGITIDCLGNFLVASWDPDRITRYTASFSQPGEDVGITGLSNPADIDFDPVNNRICIPNSGSNTVQLVDVGCTAAMDEQQAFPDLAVPNPTAGPVRFDRPFHAPEPYMVVDARGLLQAVGTLGPGHLLDLGDLPAGMYTIRFTRQARSMRVMKE